MNKIIFIEAMTRQIKRWRFNLFILVLSIVVISILKALGVGQLVAMLWALFINYLVMYFMGEFDE